MGWYEDYPDNWDKIRKLVYKRDGYACQKCGRRGGTYGNAELHCHHIKPKSEGGSDHPRNLQTLCWRCHNAEHDHHIQRMSDVSRKSSSLGSSSRSSQSTASPGFDPSSMDSETEQLRDIFMNVSGQEASAGSEQTGSTDTGSGTDDDEPDWEQHATEYTCPNCGGVIKRTGWFSLCHHFKRCELPSERPPHLSEKQWKKVQAKVKRSSPSLSKTSSSSSKPTGVADMTGGISSSTSAIDSSSTVQSTRNRIGTVSIFYVILWISSLHLTEWIGLLFPMLVVAGTASHIGYVWYTQNPSEKSQAWMIVGLLLVVLSASQYISLHNTATRYGMPVWEAYEYGSLSVFLLVVGHLAMRKGMLANYTIRV